MKKTSIQIIITTLILLAIVVAVIFNTKNNSDTRDIQNDLDISVNNKNELSVYDKRDLGISFNYPKSLFLIEETKSVQITSIPPNDPMSQSSATMKNLSL
ncbi:MAG: PsbP-related protein, partial [Bacteroidia bacterium]